VENGDSVESRTKTSEFENEREVKFPKKIKHRGQVLAKIYRKAANYPFYPFAESHVRNNSQ